MRDSVFSRLRKIEFPQLRDGQVYADWTGAALPPASLITTHTGYLMNNILGNPHSHHAPSARAMEDVMTTRAAILRFFNASPDEYEVIFTSGATQAIQHLQHYMFNGGELLLTAANHNSVNGLREMAKCAGAVVRYAPIDQNLEIKQEDLTRMLSHPRSNHNRLFCYPAKSNYGGTVHPLDWVKIAKQKGWDVMLDAAAYVANNPLNLSEVKPDYIPISFYKMFGYPTGLGCLLIRKEAYKHMHKKYFAGGSILLVSVQKDFFAPESLGYARYEDGTINFAQIPAIKAGLEFVESLGDIKHHVLSLTCPLYDALKEMANGDNAVILHSKRGTDTVTFSVKKNGRIMNAWEVERAANERGIFIRSGCFCNPGDNEQTFGYGIEPFEKLYNDAISPDAITVEGLAEYADGKPIGALRASFGYANNISDVNKIVEFLLDLIR